ncbi:hypothetical protein ASE16_13410 [Leifsonia sp. Root227]|uniref:cupin domain-containing protein n=1 Tax=Leifsonia sp. Root227 TaxID=1736496 RepID=UPI0006FD3084|nr:cupin domain-containing protein [Leifsonia sp. Root227]KRC49694.1 hypothetical protein ASE16_13410 [Leifsonia sp. Root227]
MELSAENPVVRVVVQDVTLPEPRPFGRIQSRRITIAPGAESGLHVHNGPVIGSIETGTAIYQTEGGEERVLIAGDLFYEPEGGRIARFDAGPQGVTFLGHFPVGADEEPSIEFP